MNPCAIGLSCPHCIEYACEGDLKCTYPTLMVAYKWKKREIEIVGGCDCPLVEESSELYDWLQVMDDPTVRLAIEKANKVLHDRAIHKRMRIEEQEKKADKDDPF